MLSKHRRLMGIASYIVNVILVYALVRWKPLRITRTHITSLAHVTATPFK